jgi:hypothetical protein
MPRKPHGERSRWWRSNGSAHTGAFEATATLRGRDGFVWLLQLRSPFAGGMARGVGTHDAELHSLRSRRRRCDAAAFALQHHGAVASREACDTRSATRPTSIEAGDG